MNSNVDQLVTRPMGMAEAWRDAIRIAMKTDPRVFLIGEDIGVKGGFGGGFTVTLGLSDEFDPERVVDTPISEGAIVGAAIGAAMVGMRPVAEMQYGDFVFCAMDQVVNQAAKMRYMSNGQVRVPMVLRLPVGASQRGAQHGQSTEALFMHTPGLKVVCPSTPRDAKGMLLAAIRDDNPVVFLEHKLLYGGKGTRKESASISFGGDVPEGDYTVPLGPAAVRRPGSDVTLVANMLMVHRAYSAAELLATRGIDVEVIDMRSFTPLDMETVAVSLAKTGRLLVVEEDNLTYGWGAEVLARVAESHSNLLKRPIRASPVPIRPRLARRPRAGLRAGRGKNRGRCWQFTGVTAADRPSRQLVQGPLVRTKRSVAQLLVNGPPPAQFNGNAIALTGPIRIDLYARCEGMARQPDPNRFGAVMREELHAYDQRTRAAHCAACKRPFAVQQPAGDRRMGLGPWLQGTAAPELRHPLHRPPPLRREPDLRRRDQWSSQGAWPSGH
jgi:pyruvate dehydrogenase E1 component beta subunit